MKPLARKAYGSIGHLPGSRLGPGDHHVNAGQARIATEKTRDRHDVVIVQEKLDGGCVAVARMGDALHSLTRSGLLAQASRWEHHRLFAAWVREREDVFRGLLEDGERVVGEWLALAHGTLYDLADRSPFVAFDIMREDKREPHRVADKRLRDAGLATPHVIHCAFACSIADALAAAGPRGWHGALEPIEGFVWRVERNGRVDFLAKWVRPDKVDGKYLPEITGAAPVWNWRP